MDDRTIPTSELQPESQSGTSENDSRWKNTLPTKKSTALPLEEDLTIAYPVSLVEQITKFLTTAIMEGKLASGQPLVENEIQRRFGISRSPIRESFRILEKNGLVVSIPRKGTFVRQITRKDIEENFPIRAMLEGFAAQLAASRWEPEHLSKMELALSLMTEAAKENDSTSYFKKHSDFHDALIAASKNDTLIAILDNLRRHSMWFRFTYLWHKSNYDYSVRVHTQILDLTRKRDADKLEALVKEHTLVGFKDFLSFLDSNTDAKNQST